MLQFISPTHVSTGIAEDLAMEQDLCQNYLFAKADDTKAKRQKVTSKITVQHNVRDNAIV